MDRDVLDTSIKSIFNERTTFAKCVELCDEKIRESDYTLLTVENTQL